MIHCKNYKCFKSFGELVSDESRKGDVKPEYKILAEECKNIGNSAFGRTAMNKEKHTKTVCKHSVMDLKRPINTPYFVDADQYGETYEISKRKRVTKQNMPI